MTTCISICEPNVLAAYLYLHLAEQMPPEGTSEAAFERWALSPEPAVVSLDVCERFLRDLDVLCDKLRQNPEDAMTQFYDCAKLTFDGDKKQIRNWFKWLYLILFGYPDGPRWGEYVSVVGVDYFIEQLHTRLRELNFVN